MAFILSQGPSKGATLSRHVCSVARRCFCNLGYEVEVDRTYLIRSAYDTAPSIVVFYNRVKVTRDTVGCEIVE